MAAAEKHKKGLREALTRQMRFASEEEREVMAATIESELPVLLREAFGVELESIYDMTSASMVRDIRNRVVTNPAAKALDETSHGRLNSALKYYADFLDSKFNPAKKKPKAIKQPKTTPEPEVTAQTFVEGATVQQTTDRRERNSQARQDCIAKKGCKCIVCGFDFEAVYGPVGRNYIEVHHLKPISQTDEEHEVSAEDLVPLCANCHAMAHRRSPEPFTPQELKEILEKFRI